MSEMVERLTRKMRATGLDCERWVPDALDDLARAVLQELRDHPTEAMLHAYDDLSGSYTGFWASDRQTILEGYQAMLDKALEE